jgi:hypothetical protein
MLLRTQVPVYRGEASETYPPAASLKMRGALDLSHRLVAVRSAGTGLKWYLGYPRGGCSWNYMTLGFPVRVRVAPFTEP